MADLGFSRRGETGAGSKKVGVPTYHLGPENEKKIRPRRGGRLYCPLDLPIVYPHLGTQFKVDIAALNLDVNVSFAEAAKHRKSIICSECLFPQKNLSSDISGRDTQKVFF